MTKHDCLRIGIINQHEAIVYYKDGTTVSLYSDNDVRSIIEIVCTPFNCDCTWEELVHSTEDTQSINIGEVS